MNMKSFFILSVLFLGASALTREQYNTQLNNLMKLIGSCRQKEKATPGDLAELAAKKIPPASHGAKCILACFYEHYKILTPEGTRDKQAAIDAVEVLKDMDADLYAKALQIIETCSAKKLDGEDRCETASLMATCALTEAEALGITEEALLMSE